ncbi:hypothetical protein ACIQOU_05970 [Streptomyces sp. NPDC091279]|uniref:hypothetical protein n=1 Tax=unclassified Streptomyces TaxID=2593676 RepID=UPI0038285C66
MSKRTRTGALLVLAATVLGAAATAPANAAPHVPGFLTVGDLPAASSAWTAGRVTAGVPEETEQDTCLQLALPGQADTWYRDFRTDLDTGARQISVVLPDTAAAKGLFARVNQDIRSCPARIEEAYPWARAEFKDYGTLAVEDGAHVYGLHTGTAWGAADVRLLSVGRDGRTVTVVDWGRLGGFEGVPVKAFKRTTVTAVDRLA